MANNIELPYELVFKKDWVWDPPPPFLQKMEIQDIARMAVTQLRMQHGILKLQEEALEETLKIVSRYADMR
ncbi:MAG: hypothetical protein QNJ22_02945 [Desulfosarcinaceae bacterium]|nr:hypothetical protein [Desulfosarcinaceae bacterium]